MKGAIGSKRPFGANVPYRFYTFQYTENCITLVNDGKEHCDI